MRIQLFILPLIILSGVLFAQDFFDDDDDFFSSGSGSSSGSSLLKASVSGEIEVDVTPYAHDFAKEGGPGVSFWDMVSGDLNFSLSGKFIEGFANFNLNAAAISELWNASSDLGNPSYTPLIIDEAYLRAFIGQVNIEAGLRKLTWGRADVLGPLDVTNPLDYTDLRNLTDITESKIARPMVHVTWNTGDFSKLEGVFIPNFAGHRFAMNGRWTPAQFSNMTEMVSEEILKQALQKHPQYASVIQSMYPEIAANFSGFSPEFPSTAGLDYFQAGLRYTTTIGSADIGGQYFYGNLFQPGFTLTASGIDTFLDDLPSIFFSGGNFDLDLLSPQIKYNRYHQIGLDYAQVLFDFNVRAELAAFLTEDLSGDDGSVQNPFIGWSLGFDRDLFWGISALFQCNQNIRLLHSKLGSNPVFDAEAGKERTATRLTMQLSKKFFRDNLESRVTAIWDIENSDCYIIPAFIWTMDDLSAELSAGVFTGRESGDLGHYWENSFVRIRLKYVF